MINKDLNYLIKVFIILQIMVLEFIIWTEFCIFEWLEEVYSDERYFEK